MSHFSKMSPMEKLEHIEKSAQHSGSIALLRDNRFEYLLSRLRKCERVVEVANGVADRKLMDALEDIEDRE